MRTRLVKTLLVVLQAALVTGCGTLLRVGGSTASLITFEAGELRSKEEISLGELDLACSQIVEILGYKEVEVTREANRILWKARTAGGDPVLLLLIARSSERTELRIRVGVLGNEAQARLVLEQIHQSL